MLGIALLTVIPIFGGETIRGTWEGDFRAQNVYVNVRVQRTTGTATYGRSFTRKDLGDVVRPTGDVSFKLVRDAGIIEFRGREHDGEAGGSWLFTPNVNYAKEMDRLGFKNLTPDRLLAFAITDLSVADAKFLEEATTDDLNTLKLLKLVNNGVDADFVKSVADDYHRTLRLDELLRLRERKY